VKILLDECIDWRLARDIEGHDVKTARQMGWTAIKNGELLALASAHFDVFVTVDRNLSFQQNLAPLPIAVFVLYATTNRLSDLRPLAQDLLFALKSARQGTVTVVEKL
jgi:predicted nuclease of predicted toxin-antitoxin system